MWGATRESFGLQLVLLAELLGQDPHAAMAALFGPGPAVDVTSPLDDAWAQAACDKISKLGHDPVAQKEAPRAHGLGCTCRKCCPDMFDDNGSVVRTLLDRNSTEED